MCDEKSLQSRQTSRLSSIIKLIVIARESILFLDADRGNLLVIHFDSSRLFRVRI